MNLKASILDLIKLIPKSSFHQGGNSKNKAETTGSPTAVGASDSLDLSGSGFLDGMSSATARIVIERNLPKNFKDIYDIKELLNQGRYYIAKIIEPPNKVVARLLVDKLNGTVHFPKNSLKS